MNTRYLLVGDVLRRVPYSASSIWRLEKTGSFPRRVKLGPNRVGWREHEIEEWLRDPPGWSLIEGGKGTTDE